MRQLEKCLLQIVIVCCSAVPISAGLMGILTGAAFLGGADADLDNHFRYLSGLLLGIGVGFLTSVPHIERHTPRVRLLTAIVVVGGLGRLYGMAMGTLPSMSMQLALIMELVVTPLLCLWQTRVARRFTR